MVRQYSLQRRPCRYRLYEKLVSAIFATMSYASFSAFDADQCLLNIVWTIGHGQVFLHSLPASCFFNIVIFGSSFQTLFPQVCSYQTFHHHHCQPIIVIFFIITTIATVIPIIIFVIPILVIILPFTEPSLH